MKMWIHVVCLVGMALVQVVDLQGQVGVHMYGDEWISEEQSYYKFEIIKEGIYRIPTSLLLEAGISISDIPHAEYQLYTLGEEVPIRISTAHANILQSGDFIEFYGIPNDGSVDALLYTDPDNQQLNPYISLYSHARPYYLTWRPDENGQRYEERTNGLEANGLPPQEPYYMHREVITYDEFHHKPSHDGRNFIRYSSMDDGEGYGSPLERERTINLNVDRVSYFGIDPRVIMRFGTNVLSRNWRISTDERELTIASQRSYGVIDIDKRFPFEELKEGIQKIHIAPLSKENEKHSIARIELHYPRLYEFDGEHQISFYQQASIISRYIEIKGFGGTQPIMYNLTNQTYLYPGQEGDLIKFTTPGAPQEHQWILIDQTSAVETISELREVSFTPKADMGDYLIISHDDLISTGSIDQYAAYRASVDGGGYNPSIISIDDLIERYAYGIKGHPIAIKRLMHYLRDQDDLPDFTFIIGKGREYTEIKEGQETNALVPTFGIPGSDNLFLAFDDQRHPQRAIGRLAAQTDDEVMDYLNKIKSHEIRGVEEQTKEDQLWKKGVIHLSGGSANNQATLFRFLNDMGDVISNNSFGAEVFTFRKTSADPLQRVTTDEIMTRVDQGAALLTFFGHSAVGTFDFSLEDPSKYSNERRNPIVLSLGCHSGNIHTSVGGISEDFVLEKEKGAIAFIASSGTAYPEPQYFTGINFYDLIGGDMYGEPIGHILQQSLEARTDNPSISVQTLIEQLTLHGDPAYRFGAFEGPDYTVDQESVAVEPGILNATTPKFTVRFNVLNLGAMKDEVLDIRLIHQLPDERTQDTIFLSIPAPAHSAEVTVDINNPGAHWVGSNRMLIEVDPSAQIRELPSQEAEQNNELISLDGDKGVAFFVFDNSAKPVQPSNFGIASEAEITLIAAVNNGLNPGGKFVIQIDTSASFDSPLFTEEIRDNKESIINWVPDIEHISDVVYYWRIAPIEDGGRLKANSWQSSSFLYWPGGPNGWNQSHFYQWEEDDYYKMSLRDDRSFQYDERIWDIRIKNAIRDEGDFWVYVNSTPWASLNPRGQGTLLSIFAWDRQDVIFRNNGSDYGSIPFTSDGFIYKMEDMADVENVVALLDAIPEGARVFFHTMLDDDRTQLNIIDWNTPLPSGISLMDKLENLGALRVKELNDKGTVPYTFIFDKGAGVVVEDIANNIYETVDLTSKARTLWSEGTITSVPIQAQDRWLRLMWSEEKSEGDATRLLVMGIKSDGAMDTLKKAADDYDINLTSIDPRRYPQIQLVYETMDDAYKTAPQLSYWRVVTNELPDAAFYSKSDSFQIVDTINAGEELILDFDMINLTDTPMEPILIKYTWIDENYKEHIIVKRSRALRGRDTINILEDISTDRLSGNYQLVIELNPNNEQGEVTACNNLGFTNIYVIPDKRNPFLDVTFDGRHIQDREKIAPTSEIVVTLRDEESFVMLDDPRDFTIRLTYPNDSTWAALASDPDVEWIPSSSIDDNRASFIIRPDLDQEGIYGLEVQAKDVAGNLAGDQAYRITFEVDFNADLPKLTVSPNPMTTFAEFAYYLDSDILPVVFDLYIYTVDGKLVRHAGKSDFGGLRRGLNTYRWDGLTDYGNELSTGLYFYEIINSFDSRREKRKGSVLKLN